jgi:hypothetical protein
MATSKEHYDPREHALFTPDFIVSLALQYATSRGHVTRTQHVSGPTLANATMALLAPEKCAAPVRHMHAWYNHWITVDTLIAVCQTIPLSNT